MRATPILLGSFGLGGLALAWWWSARTDAQDEDAAMTLQTTLAQDSRIPFRVRRWAQVAASAAVRTVPSGVDPALWGRSLLGVMDRESCGGDCLRPAGPTGTGDFVARTLSSMQRYHPAAVPLGLTVAALPAGWFAPKDRNGVVLPPPYVIPGDGLGFGRGLMQIDWAVHDFARTAAWSDPNANVRYGAGVLRDSYRAFASFADSGTLVALRLALAAYNAGAGNVRTALAANLSPDAVTTGGDYGADVMRRVGIVA